MREDDQVVAQVRSSYGEKMESERATGRLKLRSGAYGRLVDSTPFRPFTVCLLHPMFGKVNCLRPSPKGLETSLEPKGESQPFLCLWLVQVSSPTGEKHPFAAAASMGPELRMNSMCECPNQSIIQIGAITIVLFMLLKSSFKRNSQPASYATCQPRLRKASPRNPCLQLGNQPG